MRMAATVEHFSNADNKTDSMKGSVGVLNLSQGISESQGQQSDLSGCNRVKKIV